MTDKFYLKEVCGEYKFYEEGDSFPLTEKQIVNKLNENEQLKQSYKEFEDECQSTFNAMSRKQNDLYRKNFKLKEENEQLKQQIKDLRIGVLDSIHEAEEIQCTCTPCVVEECVKRVI